MERLTRNAPALLLAVAAAVAAAVLLVLASKLTFYADTWEILVERRDPSVDAYLDPHNEHLILLPVLFGQVILRVFGMTSAMPEYVLLTAMLIATALLLYVYVKRRLGPWPALFGAVLVLFLGPAWEVLLWPFEIGFVGPMLFGIAMLLALEREDRRGDLAACAFLTIALAFSSPGIPFVVAAAVVVLLGPRETWPRRAYVFVVPALLFAVWYLGWGHEAESHLGLRNLLAAPRAVVEAVGVGVACAAAVNLVVLKDGADYLEDQAVLARADTAAIEIARDSVDPGFQLGPEVAGTPVLVNVFAAPYLEAVDEYGSPAYTVAELVDAPEAGRRQADVVLGQALPLATVTQAGEYPGPGGPGCQAVIAGNPPEVAVGPGTTVIEVAPGPPAAFSLRRFAQGEYPVVTEGAPGGSTTRLRIPADRAEQPWYLRVEASQPARVCRGKTPRASTSSPTS